MVGSKSASTATVMNDDTYQSQRSSDPIKYGEMLVRMQESGRTQKEIADELSCHRQMVGRYQRIGKWSAGVKAFIQANREKVTNTKILNLASRPLSDKELLAELKVMAGETHGGTSGDLVPFPTVSGFNELMSKLEAIEKRLHNLEACREQVELNPLPTLPPSGTPKLTSRTAELTWAGLFQIVAKPYSVLLMICIAVLTSYLVYQGVVFFSAIDPKSFSALSSAVISELVPFLAAACFALAIKISHRGVALVMLLTSIVGLGFFMHKSLSIQITQGSGSYERLNKSRELALASIASYSSALAALPDTHISRRQEIAAKISLEREELSRIDSDIESLERGGKSSGIDLSYALWIRIATMLLNAYLIHLFFSGFRHAALNDTSGSKPLKIQYDG